MRVQKFDELAVAHKTDAAEGNDRRKPQRQSESIVEFVREVMTVLPLGAIRV